MRAGALDRQITIERKAVASDLADYISPDASFGTEQTVWVPLVRDGNAAALYLPGIVGNYASTPDSAANSVTGDIDIRIKFALRNWSAGTYVLLINKWVPSNLSWVVAIQSDGLAYMVWSADGSSNAGVMSSSVPLVVPASSQTKYLRVTLDVNNGSGGTDARFLTSDDNGASWNQLGALITNPGVTSIFDGTSEVRIGTAVFISESGLSTANYYAELRNGINGPVVAAFDPTRAARGATSVSSATGEIWAINQSGDPHAELAGGGFPGERFWARKQDALPNRSEALTQGAVVARQRTYFFLRYRDDIDSSMRIRLHGDGADTIYQIVDFPAVVEREGRKTEIMIACERYSS